MKHILLVYFLFIPLFIFSQSDSIYPPQKKTTTSLISYHLALSGTFSAQHNWYNDDNNYKSIAFLFNGDYNYRLTTPKFKQSYSFRSAVGYMKVIDSIWIKNNDYWRINATIIENQNKNFTHTYSLIAKSQFLNTWKYVYSDETDSKQKKLKSKFFNPANITLSYGLSWTFWNYCFINFNFAAINFNTKPRFDKNILPNDHELAKTKNMYTTC